MGKKLADIMTEEVVFLTPQDSVRAAAEQMKALNVGVIPICSPDRRLLGLITDRDIVVRVIAEGRGVEGTLDGCYTKDPVTGLRDWDVKKAVEIMKEHQIRRLPIVENGVLCGIVSLGDVAVDQSSDKLTGDALEEISQPARPRKGEPGDGTRLA